MAFSKPPKTAAAFVAAAGKPAAAGQRTIRLNCDVAETLYRKAQIKALGQRRKLADVVRDLLASYTD